MKTILQSLLAAINLYSEYFLGLIISIIIARNLTTDDYGLYSSTIWLAGLITIGVNAGLSITVTKFIAEFKEKSQAELSALYSKLCEIKKKRQWLVFGVAIVLLTLNFGETQIDSWLLLVLITCSIMKADYIFKMSAYKGLQRFDILAKTGLIVNPANLIIVLICALINPSVEFFLLSYCATCLIYGLTCMIFKSSMPDHSTNIDILELHNKRINTQIISATVIVLLGALIFKQSQVVILEQNGFLSEAGFFNIAFLLATATLTLVPGVYQEVLLPKMAKALVDGNATSQVVQAERYLLILSLLVAVPVIVYADVVINILYGERYQAAILPLQIMVVFRIVAMLTQGANLTLISKDKQVSMAKTHVLMMIITVLLSGIFVPIFGINGALAVYGVLVMFQWLAYQFLARKEGYSMLSIALMTKIVVASLLSTLPFFLINDYLNGIAGAVVGTTCYILCYANCLFIFKGYDNSVTYLLKRLLLKTSGPIFHYLTWCIKKLST